MPIAALVPHFAVLGIWAACGAIATGVGLLILRLLVPPPGRGEGMPFAALWIGLAAITLFLQVWHFAFPIDGLALLIVVAAGLTGLALSSRAWIARLPRRRPEVGVVVALLFFLGFAGWVADLSLAVFAAHDSEVYLVPAVEWAKARPVVPGLGALHGRLAFNNATVLLAALLEAGPWPPAAPHLLSGFFLSVMAGRIASRICRAGNRVVPVFDVLLLAPLVAMALDDQLHPSLSADVAVAVAVFAAASLLLERLAGDPAAPRQPAAPVAAAAALALALTLKLSAAVFALAGGALAVRILAADAKAGAMRAYALALASASGLALVGTWVIRGVVLSGYPLYPSTLLPAPVDWRVPAQQAQAEAAWIGHFARTWYDTALANADSVAEYSWSRFHWLRPWFAAQVAGRDIGMVVLPALLGCLSGFFLLLPRKSTSPPGVRWLATGSVAALLYWFILAPRPDMGLGPAWVLASLATALLFERSRGRAAVRPAFAFSLVLAALVAANAVRTTEPDPGTSAWRAALLAWVDPEDWFREPAAPAMREYRTASGLVLSVPVRTNLCRREPPPCTPHPAPNLRLRRPGEPGGGFAVEGGWKAERWPNGPSQFLRSWLESQGR